MKTWIIAVGLLASTGLAHADEAATTVCYAGAEEATVMGVKKTAQGVVERTLDPAKHAIRETVWTPGKEKMLSADVDAKAGTFTWKADDGKSGTGTLVGPAWHWTAQTTVYTHGDVKAVIESTRAGDTVSSKATITKGGKLVGGNVGTFTVFDCSKLADKRAALK